MAFKKRRHWWDYGDEQPKDHEAIPEGLGLGVREERTEGGLYIWLEPSPIPLQGGWAYTPYLVLGKYAEPQWDGSVFYVGDWTKKGVNAIVTKHEHLITAIAAIQEIINDYETSNKGLVP